GNAERRRESERPAFRCAAELHQLPQGRREAIHHHHRDTSSWPCGKSIGQPLTAAIMQSRDDGGAALEADALLLNGNARLFQNWLPAVASASDKTLHVAAAALLGLRPGRADVAEPLLHLLRLQRLGDRFAELRQDSCRRALRRIDTRPGIGLELGKP